MYFFAYNQVFGQVQEGEKNENTRRATQKDSVKVSESFKRHIGYKEVNSQTKAALMAAIVPGFGQAYNRKYWKMPLAYGGFVVFAGLFDFNHVRYVMLRDALALQVQGRGDEIENPLFRRLNQDQLRRGRDRYRRDRDFNVILTFGWYGLTIADAVVDAHMREFSVDEDLSFKIKPSFIDTGFNQLAAGISLTLYLRN